MSNDEFSMKFGLADDDHIMEQERQSRRTSLVITQADLQKRVEAELAGTTEEVTAEDEMNLVARLSEDILTLDRTIDSLQQERANMAKTLMKTYDRLSLKSAVHDAEDGHRYRLSTTVRRTRLWDLVAARAVLPPEVYRRVVTEKIDRIEYDRLRSTKEIGDQTDLQIVTYKQGEPYLTITKEA